MALFAAILSDMDAELTGLEARFLADAGPAPPSAPA